MRNSIKVLAAGAAMMLMTTGAGFAGPVSTPHPAGGAVLETGVLPVQYGEHCERLRYRCEHKEELGREGEGTCHRYREECGERAEHCEHLRRACEHKEARGEEGEGNCRRYREECGEGGRY